MENKFCSNCGTKLEGHESICPNCGQEIKTIKKEAKVESHIGKIILDIIGYVLGIFLFIGGIANIKNGNWYGAFELFCALSCFPFIYNNIVSLFIQNNRLIRKLQIAIPVILFVILCIIIPTQPEFENNSSTDVPSTTGSNSTTNSNNSNKTTEIKEPTKEEKMIISISNLISEGLAFDTGSYIKGEIPTGEYAFVKLSGGSGYYEEEDASGNIVDNENFDSFGYVKVHAVGNITTRGVLIHVSAFAKLGVSGAKEIYEILDNQTNYNQSGYYKVGVDIPAGSYVVESINRGYYAIMSGPVGNSDIVKNDNFNGKATINLKNGQYLDLSRAQINYKNN